MTCQLIRLFVRWYEWEPRKSHSFPSVMGKLYGRLQHLHTAESRLDFGLSVCTLRMLLETEHCVAVGSEGC